MLKLDFKYLKRDAVVSLLVIPLISILVGIIFSSLINAKLVEAIVISLLLTIALSLIDHNIRSQISVEKQTESNNKIENNMNDLKILSSIQETVSKLKHPYFKKLAYQKLDKFMEINQGFFTGTNKTTPHSEDTFGTDGLNYTEKNGNLKAFSHVKDYWDDPFTTEYMNIQEHLMVTKHVTIQRIFVVAENLFDKVKPIMDKQVGIGIEVYYIMESNPYINKDWLTEDYIIQDYKLLVQISCEDHKFEESEHESETVTIVPSIVKEKLTRFNKIIERATRYDGKPH